VRISGHQRLAAGGAQVTKLRLAALAVILLFGRTVYSGISGNYSLSSDTTFTSSIAAEPFTIGGSKDIFNLQGFTSTFIGDGSFEISAQIVGSGGLVIDLAAPTAQVQLNAANSFSGVTTIRGGTLFLNTPSGENAGISGDLFIGGGNTQAIVARDTKHNRELIADTTTVTIGKNGTLQFDRMDTGNSPVHDSMETMGRVVMDGGTILNASRNDRATTVNIGSVTLRANSVWDLGDAMTMHIGNASTNIWSSDAILTIKNWSSAEPIYFQQIAPEQLAQIRFETADGLMAAKQLADSQIVPMAIVPEASTFLFIPLLLGAVILPVIWDALKKRRLTTAKAS
jgi:autotransporter-associated beta strand protein